MLQEREQGSAKQHQAGVAWIRPVMGETLGARPGLGAQHGSTSGSAVGAAPSDRGAASPRCPRPRPHHFLPGGTEAAPSASSSPAGVGSVVFPPNSHPPGVSG